MCIELYNDDCFNILPKINDKSTDMICCDLPYENKLRAKWDKKFNFTKLFEEYKRIIKPNGAIVLFGNEPFSTKVRSSMIDLYKYDWKWVKSKTTGFQNSNYRPMNKYEDIMVFSYANASSGGKQNSMIYNPQNIIPIHKTKKNTRNRQGLISEDTNNLGEGNSLLQDTEYVQKYTNYPCNVLYFDNPKKYYHPTQKPVELLEYLIRTYTYENDVVLDNTMGSGSTGIACIQTNRNFIGIEKVEKYYEIAKQRINEAKAQRRLI